MKLLLRLILLVAFVSTNAPTWASDSDGQTKRSEKRAEKKAEKISEDTTEEEKEDEDSADSEPMRKYVSRAMFAPHIGRVDRDINPRTFAYKGEIMAGTTVSYTTMNSSDMSLFLLVDDVYLESIIVSVAPFSGYFYRDNRAIGGRFKYSKIDASLSGAVFDLGETNGIEVEIPDVSIYNESYSYSVYHRAYTAIDQHGHYGLFAEAELFYTNSRTRLGYDSGDGTVSSLSKSHTYGISFNPGVSAFVLNNVCATVSFEFGGIKYTKVRQYGSDLLLVGERDYSQMKFKINLLAINIGLVVHLWEK